MTAALLTATEVAAILKVTPKWVERRGISGEIESVKVGNYRRFTIESVERYIAKHSTADAMQRTVRSPRRKAA
jgi:excisionase family DNA binding protein